jgi:hypothetical protein
MYILKRLMGLSIIGISMLLIGYKVFESNALEYQIIDGQEKLVMTDRTLANTYFTYNQDGDVVITSNTYDYISNGAGVIQSMVSVPRGLVSVFTSISRVVNSFFGYSSALDQDNIQNNLDGYLELEQIYLNGEFTELIPNIRYVYFGEDNGQYYAIEFDLNYGLYELVLYSQQWYGTETRSYLDYTGLLNYATLNNWV